MKQCEFCGATSSEAICAQCHANLESGASPIICVTCRERLGRSFGIVWMQHSDMTPESAQAIQEIPAQTDGAVGVFVRENCRSCRDTEMPVRTSSFPASC